MKLLIVLALVLAQFQVTEGSKIEPEPQYRIPADLIFFDGHYERLMTLRLECPKGTHVQITDMSPPCTLFLSSRYRLNATSTGDGLEIKIAQPNAAPPQGAE
jgi:hypothetical protein